LFFQFSNRYHEIQNMDTQTPNIDRPLEKVQTFAPAIGTKAKGRVRNLVHKFRNGRRFSWHMWLGTMVYLEEKTVGISTELARKGEKFETTAKSALAERAERARRAAENLSDRPKGVVSLFQNGVGRSLHLLGAPSYQDVVQLRHLTEELSMTVAELKRQTEAEIEGKGKSRSASKAS
jgi:hypothetical protein